MRGWFDAFRTDGGPTLYAYSNRTSVTCDVEIITICLVFLTIFLAFVIIFPGVRKERFSTFSTVCLSILTGIVICIANFGSSWEVSSGEIFSSYRAFSSHKIKASLGVSIGLDHANVTLKVIPTDNRSLDIDYNERFHWITPRDMGDEYRRSLEKGLPYPILTAAEYLSLDKEGFSWGRHYRSAGYYTSIVLWTAFASWLLTNILLLNVPRYGAYMMMLTGSLMGGACLTFWLLKPPHPLVMRFEDKVIGFHLGWCFWLTLVVGCVVGISGLIISIVDWIYPHKFSTILEVDFDTPYDRHIIIEDSSDTRKRRFKIPRLDEPLNAGLTVGSRLLRRLSKRGSTKTTASVHGIRIHPGMENPGFEMELPTKKPWKSSIMARTDSRNSNKSVNFRGSQKSQGFMVPDLPSLQLSEDKIKIIQRSDSKQSVISDGIIKLNSLLGENELCSVAPDIPDMQRQDSCQSCSSTSSSFGLGALTRESSSRKTSEENKHPPVTRNNSGNIIVFHRTDSRGQLQRLNGEVVEIQTDGSAENW